MDEVKHCPMCDSQNISAGPIEGDGKKATCEVECLDCGHFWVEEYELKDIVIH